MYRKEKGGRRRGEMEASNDERCDKKMELRWERKSKKK